MGTATHAIAFAAGFGVGVLACVVFWIWCLLRGWEYEA